MRGTAHAHRERQGSSAKTNEAGFDGAVSLNQKSKHVAP